MYCVEDWAVYFGLMQWNLTGQGVSMLSYTGDLLILTECLQKICVFIIIQIKKLMLEENQADHAISKKGNFSCLA